MPDWNQLSIADIRAHLQTQIETTYDIPPRLLTFDCREAAVLVPFVRIKDAWHILYIRRTKYAGDRHSGQVAFAGGKRDPKDVDLTATVLREAEEEIGLAASDVKLLGNINQHHTISKFQVTPFIAEIPWPYPLALDEVEVARAFTLPLSWLADASNYRTEKRLHPSSNQLWPVVYYDYYDGELLWGATARMTLSLIEILKKSIPN
ncbi:MAG: CoA pyrophosphatase [Gammaproteobacteria bacterium]|nr:CoA pyrophosphatase [Gammaproteobacteria bacterium]